MGEHVDATVRHATRLDTLDDHFSEIQSRFQTSTTHHATRLDSLEQLSSRFQENALHIDRPIFNVNARGAEDSTQIGALEDEMIFSRIRNGLLAGLRDGTLEQIIIETRDEEMPKEEKEEEEEDRCQSTDLDGSENSPRLDHYLRIR